MYDYHTTIPFLFVVSEKKRTFANKKEKNEIKILNERLETFFKKTYLPKIILIENDGLGEEGTITNALEIFYSKD